MTMYTNTFYTWRTTITIVIDIIIMTTSWIIIIIIIIITKTLHDIKEY